MTVAAAKRLSSGRRLVNRPSFLITVLLVGLMGMVAFSSPLRAEMDPYPVVKLRSLDKIAARTMTFEARVGSTVKFGPLYIKVQTCKKAPPIEQPESAAFLQIWEVTPEGKSEWVFSGWMFASSPALSAMDHPVYDVWVLDCLPHKTGEEQAKEEEPEPKSGTETDAAAQDAENQSVKTESTGENTNTTDEDAAGNANNATTNTPSDETE